MFQFPCSLLILLLGVPVASRRLLARLCLGILPLSPSSLLVAFSTLVTRPWISLCPAFRGIPVSPSPSSFPVFRLRPCDNSPQYNGGRLQRGLRRCFLNAYISRYETSLLHTVSQYIVNCAPIRIDPVFQRALLWLEFYLVDYLYFWTVEGLACFIPY